jgi:multiple sugar transport system substrate-binding protein
MSENTRVKQLWQDALSGRISRREVMRRGAALGLSGMTLAALSQESIRGTLAQDRDPILNSYDWQLRLHPGIFVIGEEQGVTVEEAPSVDFSFDRFITEKNEGFSTWDAYTGVTPFLEMKPLADTETIEPWDPYLPEGVKEDMFPATVEEGTYNGSFYVWPLLLDICVQGWHAGVVEQAGLDPEAAPQTWDEYIANVQTVHESGVVPYGVIFDNRDWRSLIPITHSFDTDVYNPDGLFIYNSDAAVNALEVMKELMQYTAPDVLAASSVDAAVLVDQAVWGSEQAGYYFKYQNAPLTYSATWADPTQLRMAKLPSQPDTAGGTVFWDTGAVLLTHGQNKEAMVEFMVAFSNDDRIWENSIKGNPDEGTTPVGQLPILQSVWEEWDANPPEFLEGEDWVFAVRDSLDAARAIQPTALAISQFDVARPEWHKYLSGEESDARTALTNAYDAVRAEFERQTGQPAQ